MAGAFSCGDGSPSDEPDGLGTDLGTKPSETAETGSNEWDICGTEEAPDLDKCDVDDQVKPSPVGS